MYKSSLLYQMIPGMISFFDWIFPPTCIGCGKFGVTLCEECNKLVEKIDGAICIKCGYPINPFEVCPECLRHNCYSTQQRAFGKYRKVIKDIVHQLKFRNGIELGYYFRHQLADIVIKEKWEITAVVPVPQSAMRRKERGYNQAAMLAWPISHSLKKPYRPDLLLRVDEKTTQVNQDAIGRLSNIAGSFQAGHSSLKGESVLIIDDVITTGSTMNECARICFDAGASNVFALAFARSILGDIVA